MADKPVQLKTTEQSKRPTRQTLDNDLVLALFNDGLSRREIAHKTGYNIHSINSLLSRRKATQALTTEFRTNRGEVMAVVGLQAQETISLLIDKANDLIAEGRLKPKDVADLLKSLAVVGDRAHYQERLEDNKSTNNIANYYGQVTQKAQQLRKERYKKESDPKVIDV